MRAFQPIHLRHAESRRWCFFLSVLAVFLFGAVLMADLLSYHGWTALKLAICALFAVLFAQVSYGVVVAAVGYWILARGGDSLRISKTLLPERSFNGSTVDPEIEPRINTDEHRLQITRNQSSPVPIRVYPRPSVVLPQPLNLRSANTAIVVPVFNEDVGRVFQGVRVMYESLQNTGHADSFDFFILSDSSNSNHWIEEEKTWLELCKQTNGFGRIFYRNRRVKLNHKSGNVADFCRRWGADYRYMIVLDADSIMTGDTLTKLVQMMEHHPMVGIIQTAPQQVLGRSLFSRIQQFAASVYGPLFAAGSNFWQLDGGNYWGHNAIVRLRPFMEYCALPELPKVGSFGGRILSHDTVEAALMRLAGYEVWFAYDLDGSYEEGPPDLLASLDRDRRWCQGNMQHLLLLLTRRLRAANRFHLLIGILSYACAPLWLLFIILNTVAVHGADSSPAHHLKSEVLFAYVIVLLLAPKMLGFLRAREVSDRGPASGSPSPHNLNLAPDGRGETPVPNPRASVFVGGSPIRNGVNRAATPLTSGFGGRNKLLLSVFLETIFSVLMAPILMMFYTKFVFAALTGWPIKWGRQNRGEERPGWRQIAVMNGGQTVVGLLAAWLLYRFSPGLLLWLSPILAGLILSIPFARITSSVELGECARRNGMFLIPPEAVPPIELREIDGRLSSPENPFFRQPSYASDYGLLQAVLDPYIHAVHVSLLRLREDTNDKSRHYMDELSRRLLRDGPASLTPEERTILLWDAESMMALHRELWICASEELADWWCQALRHYNETVAIATRRTVS